MDKAPWTPERVEYLNKLQDSGIVHPYTCNREPAECEVKHRAPEEHSKDGILIATTDGWVCPCGKYKQDWAH